jgi:hypothetical protein
VRKRVLLVFVASCGGNVELPPDEPIAPTDVDALPTDPCANLATSDACCEDHACAWLRPRPDFTGGCVLTDKSCASSSTSCPDGLTCYVQEAGPNGWCPWYGYGIGHHGSCVVLCPAETLQKTIAGGPVCYHPPWTDGWADE